MPAAPAPAAPASAPPVPPRDRLVDTAARLFSRDGFHATGIDRVLAEAGVAKMTLYKHFRSKDELVAAVLDRRSAGVLAAVEEAVAAASDARGRLLALFDVLATWCGGPSFEGCLFANAASEYGRREDPVHAAAARSKRGIRDLLLREAVAARAPDPAALADELMLLHEGAIAVAYVTGDDGAAARARDLAGRAVDRVLGGGPPCS
jgi:AcrR family transcriptional regulator